MINETREQEDAQQPFLGAAEDTDGERALWLAVLHQARHDASRTVRHKHWRTDRGQGGVTLQEQADARAFLNDPERLGPICELLDIDPAWFIAQGRLIPARKQRRTS